MMEWPAGAMNGGLRVTLTVEGGPFLPEDLAGFLGVGRCFQARECFVDHSVDVVPESALSEICSKSANAFPAIESAVLVFPSSFLALSSSAVSFLFSARNRANSAAS